MDNLPDTPPVLDPPAGNAALLPPRTFSQPEVDAIIRERLERERRKYADYEALKAQTAALQSQIVEMQARLESSESRSQESETRRRATLIQTALLHEATRLGFSDPADALKMVDMAAITVGAGDQVSGAHEALHQLAQNKPYLVKASLTSAPVSPANPARRNSADLEWLLRGRGSGASPLGSGGVTITGEGE